MKFLHNEKLLQRIALVLGILSIGCSFLHLFLDRMIPGLEPAVSALFWAALWRFFVVKGTCSGKKWAIPYILIILMNLSAAVSQIHTACFQ